MENKKVQGTVQLILGFMDRIKTDHIGAYAAQAAYFLIMSFIPFVLVLTAHGSIYPADLQNSSGRRSLGLFRTNLQDFVPQHHCRGIHKECGGRTNLNTFCTVVLR